MEEINEWVKKTIANKTMWMLIAIFIVSIVVMGLIVGFVRSRASVMPNTNYTM
jgi:preprotein translocase subunit SecG